MTQITNPYHGQHGYHVSWIVKDHEPAENEEYDSALAKFGYAVFTDLDEAKRFLKIAANKSGVEWGMIHEAIFEWLEGHPYMWEYEHTPLMYLEEL